MESNPLLHQALALQQKGDLAGAESLYAQILATQPDEFNANHLLGIIRFHQQRHGEALALIARSLVANPLAAEAHAHQGLVLQAMGRSAEALMSLDRALAISPGMADALNGRGMVLKALGRIDEALASLDAALAREPDYAEALNNRAILLRDLGRTDEALANVARAAALAPDTIEILFNRGLVLRDLARCREAADDFRRIVEFIPNHVAAINNLALVLCECGEAQEALQWFRRHAELVYGAMPVFGGEAAPAHQKQHDREQQEHLVAQGVRHPAQFRLAAGDRVPGAAINPDNNPDDVAQRWREARPQILVVDDLLTPEALEGLRRFSRGSTIWRKPYAGGYLGALPEYGFACPLLAQIADELRLRFGAVFGSLQLRYLWAFKCDSTLKGVNIHADFAAVNVNFWITPDEANLDPEHGGLIVWDVAAPLDWDFATYNNDEAAIRRFLAETGAKSVTIPYRANRAVIFDSDLFHETDAIAFRDGYANRRTNITMLFGRRRAHEGLAAS
jgi:tetratricopeptide (TPR) repeat protein